MASGNQESEPMVTQYDSLHNSNDLERYVYKHACMNLTYIVTQQYNAIFDDQFSRHFWVLPVIKFETI